MLFPIFSLAETGVDVRVIFSSAFARGGGQGCEIMRYAFGGTGDVGGMNKNYIK